MGFDEEYLEDLLKSIEPIIYPDGRPEADDVPEMPEEELDSRIAEPQDSVMPEEEPAPVEEPAPAAGPAIEMDGDPNKQLSADEIAALFAAADGGAAATEPEPAPVEPEAPAEEASDDKPNIGGIEYDPADGNKVLSADEISALFAAAGGGAAEAAPEPEEAAEPAEVTEADGEELDIMALLGETGEPEPAEIDTDGMSEEEIDAMLNAAKAGASEPEEIASGDDDLMALLASAGDASLDDIQSLLNADANGEAVDEAAFIAATSEEDLASSALETKEEAKARKKAEKAAKKAARKAKKGKDGEDGEDEIILDGPKKGLLSRIITALTESDEDDEERIPIDLEGEAEIDISDENRDILAELDGEGGKKKAKKSKKKKDKKGKKGKKDAPEGEGDDLDEEGGEDDGKKKKKEKKPKKPKKSKEVKEKEPERPQKKLPKKRVRRVMFLAFSILAAILVGVFGGTKLATMQDARWAFDNQDYETVYEDLYGMKLKGSDADMFAKSQTIMSMERKLTSYQNYTALGMKQEALVALIEAVDLYPEVRLDAAKYGVEGQVDYTYSQILQALSTFGLDEAEAKIIADYDSKVKYTKRIQSIVNGTPFDYSGDAPLTTDSATQTEVKPTVDDILPEESDFLPENPEDIFEVDYTGASEMTPEEIEAMNDLETSGGSSFAGDGRMEDGQVVAGDGREIEAEVEVVDSRN